jgi:hypothetical protein
MQRVRGTRAPPAPWRVPSAHLVSSFLVARALLVRRWHVQYHVICALWYGARDGACKMCAKSGDVLRQRGDDRAPMPRSADRSSHGEFCMWSVARALSPHVYLYASVSVSMTEIRSPACLLRSTCIVRTTIATAVAVRVIYRTDTRPRQRPSKVTCLQCAVRWVRSSVSCVACVNVMRGRVQLSGSQYALHRDARARWRPARAGG